MHKATMYASIACLAAVLTLANAPRAEAGQMKTVTIALESEPNQLDPHISNTWNTFRILFHIFESFVAQDLTRDDLALPEIVPALAESWDISDDRLTYTFHLRKGVKFHDGTDWNAEAAKFNLDRMINPDFEYANPIAITKLKWMWGDVESYRVVDEHTFEIKLSSPNADFLQRLTQGGVGAPVMMSPTALKKYGNDQITNHPVGTGPFKFVERVYNEKVVIDKNENYWNPARMAKVDRILMRGMAEVASRELALMSGEFDIIGTPSPDSVETIENMGFTILKNQAPTVFIMWLNLKEKPFDDVRVRRAVAMALDRENMAKYLKHGLGVPSYGILHYGGPAFDPDFRDYEYNPEKAKQLLAEAGYPNGFKTRIDWTLGGGSDVNTVADAEWIQRDLAKIGIDASIELFDNNTYWDMLAKGMREGTSMMSVSWGESSFFWLDLIIPVSALPPNGYNSGYYNNPEIDVLLKKALRSMSTAERDENLKRINRIVADDAAVLSYYTSMQSYAVSPSIKKFVIAPQHWQDFTTIEKE